MCFRVWGSCHKWSPNSSANLARFSRHTVVRDWKTWILYGCMRRSVQSIRHAVEGDTLFSEANCRTDFHAGDEATLTWMVPTVSGMRTRGLLPPLFLPAIFPVAWNCSINVFTVFLAGASLHLYWFLNRRWTVTIEFVCRNHSTIWVFCFVVSCGVILSDITGASVAKYGKKYWCMTITALPLTSSCVLSLSCIVQPKLTVTDWNTLYYHFVGKQWHPYLPDEKNIWIYRAGTFGSENL
jgi:hypothetical protein